MISYQYIYILMILWFFYKK